MILEERRNAVLKTIIEEYIVGARPVASRAISHSHGVKVSPATIRNDVAYLEEEGYVMRPHTSAGTVPTDKVYRYYVETISSNVDFSLAEQYLVPELPQEAEAEIEQWLKLAASLLADFVQNVAVITRPKASQCRFKHLDVVALHDFLAMLVLVLCEARVTQRILSFDQKITQDELTNLANKLNATCSQLSKSEILAGKRELPPKEKQITEVVVDMMSSEDAIILGRPYLEGLHLMLAQPEFASGSTPLGFLRLLEKEGWLASAFAPQSDKRKIRVIIGEENPDQTLQDLSLIISEYGIEDKAKGIVGVIGPKRMDYARAISSVNCLSSLLSESISEYI